MALSPDEPLVLVNLFSMSPQMAEKFVAAWDFSIAGTLDAPGFRGTRLHRAIDPEAPYQVVNIARWESEQHWRAAVAAAGWDSSGAARNDVPVAQPALYRVVHVTPDPKAAPDPKATQGPAGQPG